MPNMSGAATVIPPDRVRSKAKLAVSTPGSSWLTAPAPVSRAAITVPAATILVAQLPPNVQAPDAYSGLLQNAQPLIFLVTREGSGRPASARIEIKAMARARPQPTGSQTYCQAYTLRRTVTGICAGDVAGFAGVITIWADTGVASFILAVLKRRCAVE